jgi:hypothetical protein
MSHQPNWQEANVVGQDKQYKDFTEMHDAGHGKYQEQKAGEPKPTTTLPAEPSPITIKK